MKTVTFMLKPIFLLLVFLNLNTNLISAKEPYTPNRYPVFSKLTDEQRHEIHSKIKELHNQSASPSEIRSTIREMLETYGIHLQDFNVGKQFGKIFRAIDRKLTEEQKEALKKEASDLWNVGASREEIIDSLSDMLESYGIELPENWKNKAMHFSSMKGHSRFKLQLSDEQKEAIREKMKNLHEQGASPEEFNHTVRTMLQDFGVDIPEDWHISGRMGFRPPFPRVIFDQLTDEQRQEIHNQIEVMREEGTSHEEIHHKVMEMLKNYDVQLPGILGEFSPEQRKELRNRMREMRKQGKSREEIYQAFLDMLNEYGINTENDYSEEESIQKSLSPGIETSNHPNPFNPETTISYSLPDAGSVQIDVFNIQGQHMRSLINDQKAAGSYSIHWDGRDENGTLVPSGIYFYKIKTDNQTISKRMILTK